MTFPSAPPASATPAFGVPATRTRWWGALDDLLVPVSCAGCAAPGPSPCPACCAWLAGARACTVDDVTDALGLPVAAAAGYRGPARGLLVAHKESGRGRLATPLGAALADAVALVLEHADRCDEHLVLVPVPSSPVAVRRRGRDAVADLASSAAGRLDRPGARCVVGRWVRHGRRVQDQSTLRVRQRARNVAGAFVAEPARGARPVVVVDDVLTTGASLAETVRALRSAGHPVVGAATIARA